MYEFDDLPLSPVEPATNLLVAGDAMSGARELFLRMVAPTAGGDEAAVLVTTGSNAEKLYGELERAAGAVDRRQVGVVDAVSQQQGVEGETDRVRMVSSPRDLTGIGMELTDLYESFHGGGAEHVRTGLDSVSTLLMYADLETVFRFLHVFSGRVATADGLGVYVIDPSSHDQQTTQTLSQLFDGRVEVREEGAERQLRVRGLADQPREWTAF